MGLQYSTVSPSCLLSRSSLARIPFVFFCADQRRLSTSRVFKSMTSLLTLLQCYSIQSSLFSFLRPWDIAIIFYLLQYEPTEAERSQFLNVIDDIFESREILNVARRNNLQVTLLGKDLNTLQSRLVDPHNYYWYRFANPFRIFVILSGNVGDSGTPNRKYVFELAEGINFNEAKEEYQFLLKWMRVEVCLPFT